MTDRVRVTVAALLVAASLALVPEGPPASAAPQAITGKLTKSGYTVMALAANGKARVARAKHGGFKLKPPAQTVTLHLRAENGTYAGPIVVDTDGKHAILGVRAGADLGRISVRRGYAEVAHKLPEDSIDPGRWARARKGVPIGARVFGRVKSRHTRGGVPGDRDLDGLPGPLDIDDDGDRILDNFEGPKGSSGLLKPKTANEFGLGTGLMLDLFDTANANAPGSTDEQIEAALPSRGALGMKIQPGGSAELDCGGLVYCSAGGTGGVWQPEGLFQPFPECCDPDGDSFGTLTPTASDPVFFLSHGATTAQIGTGDVLIQRVTTAGAESQFLATLQAVFATVPALVSYSDTAGNFATVSYPVAEGGPGTKTAPFAVAPGADGNIALTLTFWRPQRRPIPGEPGYGEPGEWTDIGGLTYTAGVKDPLLGGDVKPCPQTAFSDKDPQLTPGSSDVLFGMGGLRDLAIDQPASPANTFTYTLNVTACLASHGESWDPNQELSFDFGAKNGADVAVQHVFFKRQP